MNMKKLSSLLLILGLTIGCTTVPITGRKQMNLLPESQMVGMAATSYNQFLGANQMLATNDPRAQQVKQVGKRSLLLPHVICKLKEHPTELLDSSGVSMWRKAMR